MAVQYYNAINSLSFPSRQNVGSKLLLRAGSCLLQETAQAQAQADFTNSLVNHTALDLSHSRALNNSVELLKAAGAPRAEA
jgi:hypothetical protein